jgi:hypothetical protein
MQSDTSAEVGIAMVDAESIFLGWVVKRDLAKVEEGAAGKITSVEPFEWQAGGGTCYRGTIEVVEVEELE